MQRFSLAFSVVVHLVVVVAVVITPIVANGDLPAPRRALDYVMVRPVDPPTATPVRRARQIRSPAVANPDAAPTEAPNSITRETGIEHFESGPDPPLPPASATSPVAMPAPSGSVVSRFHRRRRPDPHQCASAATSNRRGSCGTLRPCIRSWRERRDGRAS